MVLGFKITFPDGTPTNFVQKILDNEKEHTMRVGSRWREGQRIHMATGVRTSAYHQFNRDRPDLWFAKGVQGFHFDVDKNEQLRLHIDNHNHLKPFIYEGDKEADVIAHCDGLANGKQLFDWFKPKDRKGNPVPRIPADYEVHGQIIHWHNTLY